MNPEQPQPEGDNEMISKNKEGFAGFREFFGKKHPAQLGVVDVMDTLEELRQDNSDQATDRIKDMLYTVGYVKPEMLDVLEETISDFINKDELIALNQGAEDAKKQ